MQQEANDCLPPERRALHKGQGESSPCPGQQATERKFRAQLISLSHGPHRTINHLINETTLSRSVIVRNLTSLCTVLHSSIHINLPSRGRSVLGPRLGGPEAGECRRQGEELNAGYNIRVRKIQGERRQKNIVFVTFRTTHPFSHHLP